MSSKVYRESLTDIEREAAWTPDFRILRHKQIKSQTDRFLIGVHGTFRFDKEHHKAISGAQYFGRASTLHGHYFMKKVGNLYPAIFEARNGTLSDGTKLPLNYCGHIEMEVYAVPLRTICELDKWERNGSLTHRIPVDVRLEDDHHLQKYTSAYMYISNQEEWDSKRIMSMETTFIKQHLGRKEYFFA